MDLLKPGRIIHNSNRQLSHWQYYLVPLSVLVFVLAWALIARFSGLPDFIFPGPGQVWARALIEIGDGSLLSNALVTLGEVLLGLVLGSIAAASLGYLLAKSPTIERWLSPYIVASQAIPIKIATTTATAIRTVRPLCSLKGNHWNRYRVCRGC